MMPESCACLCCMPDWECFLCLLQVNIPYAKSVCVSGCPKDDSVCNATGLPCTTGNLYR
jgi:hypothetical protein